jgi:hypothetical protein
LSNSTAEQSNEVSNETTPEEAAATANTSFLPPSFWVFMIFGPASEAGAHSMLTLKFPKLCGERSSQNYLQAVSCNEKL